MSLLGRALIGRALPNTFDRLSPLCMGGCTSTEAVDPHNGVIDGVPPTRKVGDGVALRLVNPTGTEVDGRAGRCRDGLGPATETIARLEEENGANLELGQAAHHGHP